MALVKLGSGIAGMTGSIGGVVYARGRSGNIARNRTCPINTRTSLQQIVRTALATLTILWRSTLTSTQRGAWNTYAHNIVMKNRLGENMYLTGFNHFIRSNLMIEKLGLTLVEDGPTELSLPEKDPTLACAGSAATQNLSVTFDNALDWANEAGGRLLVFAGKPVNVTRNYFNGPWKYAGKVDGNASTPPTSPATIASPWTLVNGQKMWVYARVLRADGRLSEPFRCDFTSGA